MLIIPQIFSEKVRLYASQENWIESAAVEQLKTVSNLKGMSRAVGLPDLHPGKGSPIGAAYICEKCFYPHLVGNDIGCGMSLLQLDLKSHKLKLDKWVKKLELDEVWQGDRQAFIEEFELDEWDDALGTIGGGNHFAELQKVEAIVDEEEAESMGLKAKELQLMVHSGSRGLGQMILRRHTDRYGGEPLAEESDEGLAYLKAHDYAVKFAVANRALIGRRFMASIGAKGRLLCDMTHNSVVRKEGAWLHRKGAAPTDGAYVLIPGSRGSYSYVVKPTGEQEGNAWSAAHGAGRRWNRLSTRGRLEKKFSQARLKQTELGSRVICENKDLLYEEAPQAYKDVDRVVQDLVDAGIVSVVAVLRPLITYKTGRRKR